MIHKLKVSHTIGNDSHRIVESIPSPIGEGDIVIVTNIDGTEDTYLVKNTGDCFTKCRECSLYHNNSCLRYDTSKEYSGAYTCALTFSKTMYGIVDNTIKDTSLVFKDLGDIMEDL